MKHFAILSIMAIVIDLLFVVLGFLIGRIFSLKISFYASIIIGIISGFMFLSFDLLKYSPGDLVPRQDYINSLVGGVTVAIAVLIGGLISLYWTYMRKKHHPQDENNEQEVNLTSIDPNLK